VPASPKKIATPAAAVTLATLLVAGPLALLPTACAAQGTKPAAAAPLAPPKPIPPGGTSVVADGGFGGLTLGNQADAGTAETADAPAGLPFKQLLRLTTLKPTENVYSVQVSALTTAPVKQGDILLATFYVRALKGQAETGEARTQFVFETGAPDYEKSATVDVAIPREWKRVDVPFRAVRDSGAGEAQVCLRMGYGPQSFEVGGVSVVNYGTSVALTDLPRTKSEYAGMEPNAAWRRDAQARIEKIRKGDLTVRVVDAAGKPVKGATVAVRMKRHAFPFGSAVAAEQLLAQGPDGEKYRAFIKDNFNRVVMENDLKWGMWEWQPERAKQGVAWLRAQGIEVRGHNLIWPSWRNSPEDLPKLKDDKAALAKRIDTHITQEATAMRGQVVEWDVINEPFDNHDVMDILGRDAMIHWFKLARAADPKPTLFLNDYPPLDGGATTNAHLNAFYDNIDYLKKNGAPIGGIGFQGHFGGGAIPPARVLSGLDRFAKFGLPIAITEFDINSNDMDYQTAYTRDFLTAAFSHPAVDSIIMWGFWEGRHWLPDAALLTRDWKLKPNGQAWLDLVKKDWWTNADGTADAKGEYKTRGFYGDYEVTVTGPGGKTKTVPFKLAKGAANAPVVVTL
jgi:GH35 family endo-1,4-beta-xylanase